MQAAGKIVGAGKSWGRTALRWMVARQERPVSQLCLGCFSLLNCELSVLEYVCGRWCCPGDSTGPYTYIGHFSAHKVMQKTVLQKRERRQVLKSWLTRPPAIWGTALWRPQWRYSTYSTLNLDQLGQIVHTQVVLKGMVDQAFYDYGLMIQVWRIGHCHSNFWKIIRSSLFHPRGNFHSRTDEPVHSLNEILNVLEF